MKKELIAVGGEYQVGGFYSRGRARVIEPPKKRSYGQIYYVLVEFPDHFDKDDKPSRAEITTRDVLREWTEEDEDSFQISQQRAIKKDRITKLLDDANFHPYTVRMISNNKSDDVTWIISFSGEESKRVVEALIGVDIDG